MPKGVYPRRLVKDRFLNKITKSENGCWEWCGVRNYKGYGLFSFKGHLVSAHRFAYESMNESMNRQIPEGLQIDHLCKNRGCVNPVHLEIVTNQENCRRGNTGLHNAVKTHCPQGHLYSEENTYYYRTKNGQILRSCRICHAEREKSKRRLL